MGMDLIDLHDSMEAAPSAMPPWEDPLDEDCRTDEQVVTTRRALVRLALAATEVAARFTREQVDPDPMAWMLAPRRLFDGRTALEACLEREGCMRAVLLHGLSMGMDAEPMEVDDLLTEEADDFDEEDDGRSSCEASRIAAVGTGRRLWTASLAVGSAAGTVHAFDAVMATDRAEAERLLRSRRGPAMSGDIELREGFDPGNPLVGALVSPAIADMLLQVAVDPSSPLADGLSVSILQSFAE